MWQPTVHIFAVVPLKGHFLERAPLLTGHKLFPSQQVSCSLLPQDTSLMRTELFGTRSVPIRRGPPVQYAVVLVCFYVSSFLHLKWVQWPKYYLQRNIFLKSLYAALHFTH